MYEQMVECEKYIYKRDNETILLTNYQGNFEILFVCTMDY